MESFEEQARSTSYYKPPFWIPLASIYSILQHLGMTTISLESPSPWRRRIATNSPRTVFKATGRTPLYQLKKEANVMHWWVIGLAWVLHHQQSITRSIVKCIYEPHRHLVADDLLSPRRKQMSSNLSLFLMLLLFLFSYRKFYCRSYEAKQWCLICDWVQIHCGFYRMSEVCEATSPLPTTARRTHCLQVEDNTQQDVYLLSKTA